MDWEGRLFLLGGCQVDVIKSLGWMRVCYGLRMKSVRWLLAAMLSGWCALALADEGAEIYKRSCAVCHADGVPGTPDAPKLGSRYEPKFAAEWYRRLFAGREALLRSVLGGKGAMPPKGGDASLSDRQIEAALDYMLQQIEDADNLTYPNSQDRILK